MLIFILEFLIGGLPNALPSSPGEKMNEETKTKAQLLKWLKLCQQFPPPLRSAQQLYSFLLLMCMKKMLSITAEGWYFLNKNKKIKK